jgi:hypothetical protein
MVLKLTKVRAKWATFDGVKLLSKDYRSEVIFNDIELRVHAASVSKGCSERSLLDQFRKG